MPQDSGVRRCKRASHSGPVVRLARYRIPARGYVHDKHGRSKRHARIFNAIRKRGRDKARLLGVLSLEPYWAQRSVPPSITGRYAKVVACGDAGDARECAGLAGIRIYSTSSASHGLL